MSEKCSVCGKERGLALLGKCPGHYEIIPDPSRQPCDDATDCEIIRSELATYGEIIKKIREEAIVLRRLTELQPAMDNRATVRAHIDKLLGLTGGVR